MQKTAEYEAKGQDGMKVIICGAGQVGWQIARHLSAGGFLPVRFAALPPAPKAKGPALFAAAAKRVAKNPPSGGSGPRRTGP